MPWRPPTHDGLKGRAARNQRYDAERAGTLAVQVRNSARWQKLRALLLNRQPLCADPFLLHPGRLVPATQVDHIAPIAQRPDLARGSFGPYIPWDRAYLQQTGHLRLYAHKKNGASSFVVIWTVQYTQPDWCVEP